VPYSLRRKCVQNPTAGHPCNHPCNFFFFLSSLLLSSLELSDTQVYEPYTRAHRCKFRPPASAQSSRTGSYLRPIDSCITQLKAQGPSRTCNESKEEEEKTMQPHGRLRRSVENPTAGHPCQAEILRVQGAEVRVQGLWFRVRFSI